MSDKEYRFTGVDDGAVEYTGSAEIPICVSGCDPSQVTLNGKPIPSDGKVTLSPGDVLERLGRNYRISGN